ncbi:hypothetical protein [Maribacter sp. Hel_I_7]|jgi:hypothetical protein|uniref:hypothetical protein n=1 Tax=Maribacter sp. Hel_I_7 TaxID=1249997 RepID=UPI000479AF2F|nr:hypothetical protein [Maribacter sp. Hel_I_7]|tara:strand:- start:11074 stop:11289 length:216 start_codon:yes stop_codon:yes gene_type:complete
MKDMDENLKNLISDIDSVLKKYDLEDYSIESIDLTPMAMPIEDEFESLKIYEVKELSEEKLKIEPVKTKKK